MKSQSSTGDHARTENKYMKAWLWADSENWFWNPESRDWNGLSYTQSSKDYYMENLVNPARKEMERKATSNGVIWSNSRKG